jgi:hypothetical protein
MKLFKTTALAIAMVASSQVSAAILFDENWGFNPAGTGLAGAINPIDELTYFGISYTETYDNNGNGIVDGGDTFDDVGRLNGTGLQNDNASLIGTGINNTWQLSATFTDWTGTYQDPVGPNTGFSFDPGGTLNLFIDNPIGSACASFGTCSDGLNILGMSILTGGGNINFGNPAGADGNVDILFEVTSAAAGYWFLDLDADGTAETDVSTLIGADTVLTIGLTDSNNSINLAPGAGTVTDFVASTGLGGGPFGVGDIYTNNDGSFRPAALVPTPGVLALFGLGLLGLGVMRRKA